MTRIVGMPRNRSVYPTASARIGKNTGPWRLRRTAMKSPSTRMKTSAIRKACTLMRNFSAIWGNDSRKTCKSKNRWRISGHPGEFTTSSTSTVTKTAVEIRAMTTPRRPSVPPPRMRERRSPRGRSGAGWGAVPGGVPRTALTRRPSEGGDVHHLGQPLVLDGLKRAVRLQPGQGPVRAVEQRVALLEHQPEVLLLPYRGELAHDRALVDLHGGDEEGRREVDDDTVDLLVLQGPDGIVQRVVHRGILLRLDVLLDVVERGGG